jgi:acyl-coenzyme A thioesterase PaaI-like protein
VPVDLTDYPPPRHMLRDLAFEFEHTPRGSRGWMPAPEFVRDDAGIVRTGAIATLVDAIGGGLAAAAAAPDGWIATADLTLHLVRPIVADSVEVRATVARAGRSTVVIEARVDGDGGFATLTFSVLARRDGNPMVVDDDGGRRQFLSGEASQLTQPVYEAFGVRDLGEGTVELDMTDYVRNSLGALQGGVLAAMADAATVSAIGRGHTTADLQLYYLGLAKQGPIRTTSRVIERAERSGTVEVEIHDIGGERRCSLARGAAVRW